jgi:hypothetical protein
MGIASPQLDGRLDGVYTFATLPAATSVPNGTLATTSDQGKVWSNGTNWISISGVNVAGTDPTVSYQQPLTGASITIGAGIKTLLLDPTGTLATLTVTAPASPYDGQALTVMSSQAITALTFSANAGQTVNGAPTAMVANTSFQYRYKASNQTWYRAA